LDFLPADERAHATTEDGWWFDVTVGDVVLAVQLVSGDRWRYRAGLVRDGELVAVVDDDVPPPRPGTLELRTHGLWVEHYVETPFDHVSVGCEAFALRIDPPLDVTAQLVGDPTPFGLDLGWETVDEPRAVDRGYEIDCLVYGEILVGDERIAVDTAPGRRGHVWGAVAPDAWLTSTPLPAALGP
jgi:hypothetical protein